MSETNVIRKLQTRYYTPQADITAFEVAELLWFASKIDRNRGVLFTDQTWGALKPELKRHFSETRP